MRPRTNAQAWQFGRHDELPGMHPWDLPQQIVRVEATTETDDNGDVIMEIETDITTYRLPYTAYLRMPMRSDGSTIHHGDSPPLPEAIFIGDTFGVDGKWRLKAMYRLPNSSLNVVGITLYNNEYGYDIDCRAERGVPIQPGLIPVYRSRRGETPATRSEQPERGPYEDKDFPAVFYFFQVHPSGQGRWPYGSKPFVRQDQPGQYTSRPPARKYPWQIFNYAGEGLRHPYDPEYRG